MKQVLIKLTKVAGILLLFPLISCINNGKTSSFVATWPDSIVRTWLGNDFWANRLQDWEITDGRIECLVANSNRNVNLLTWEINNKMENFSVSVNLGVFSDVLPASDQNWIGFRLGAKGRFNDYRDNAIFGLGLDVGITSSGDLFIGNIPLKLNGGGKSDGSLLQEGILLRVEAHLVGENYILKLSALEIASKKVLVIIEKEVNASELAGSIALVSHFPEIDGAKNIRSCWFDNWKVSGDKVDFHPEREFGPIMFSQYTLSRGILKISAQMPPISEFDGDTVFLQTKKRNRWETVGKSSIDALARTATIMVNDWDNTIDTPYRLSYTYISNSGKNTEAYREGVIRKEPFDKDDVVVAGFTGNNDLGFPNQDIFQSVEAIDPDLLFFSGDQIYEGVGGFSFQREPLDKAVLDYLRKWYMFGWAYGDLLRDRPCICITDDHDVYQGNIWGAGGIAATPNSNQGLYQRSGGYRMPPEWVSMVERTQTSHLPSPVDPKPVAQGIGVYFTELNYGGVSFAILEDRKFKSGPLQIFPEALKDNKWTWNPLWESNRAGAVLMGERQLNFLDSWAKDWSNQTWSKVVLSQTILSTVNTRSETNNLGTQRRRVLMEGEYPPDDVKVIDFDTNGWPQTGRDKAIRAMRKAFAFHLAGDQHLGSTIRYGVDEFGDAGYALCVPSISNIWPRRWFPSEPGENRKPGTPKYTGDFLDAFGNKTTVYAVSNPMFTGKEPASLYDRATGYGIIRINRESRNITIECWPRFMNPTEPGAKQFKGWPITVNQLDNYGRKAIAYMPEIIVSGMENPVIQLINEKNNEIIYTLRINGNTFKPKVFEKGSYSIKVSDPDKQIIKEINSVSSVDKDNTDSLKINFQNKLY